MSEQLKDEEIVDGDEVRNALADAFDKAETADATPDPKPDITPDPTSDPTPDPEPKPDPDPTPLNADNVPDPDPQADPQPAPVPESGAAPASWSATARETWANIPDAAKEIITKREGEVVTAMNESAEARQFHTSFNAMTGPFQGMFTSQNVQPLEGIYAVLQTASVLQGGSAQARAQTLAQLVKDYNIDIGMLDDAIVGTAPESGPPSPELEELRQQVRQQGEYITQQQQTRQLTNKTEQDRMNDETTKFMKENEFAKDVSKTMIEFFDVADARGYKLTLEDAYTRALQTRPDILQIIANRASVTTDAAAVAAAGVASSSIPQSSGVEQPPAPPGTMREALENAYDQG